MRARIILIPVVLLAALSAAGCGGRSDAASTPASRHLVASFYPLAYAAQELGGPTVRVDNLTPAGAEPHDLELTPGDVRKVREADLVLLLGRGFQPQLEDAAGHGDRVLRLLDTPGLGVTANNDPHVWLDPHRYALIVQRVGRALGRPSAPLVAKLRALDGEYRRSLARCTRHEIVTSHEAFGYLSRRYGLKQIAVTGLNPEAEPSPQALRAVVDEVRRTRASTVFAETLVSPRVARTVARDAHARVDVLNPIEGLTKEQQAQGASYFTLMRANLASLRRALGCR